MLTEFRVERHRRRSSAQALRSVVAGASNCRGRETGTFPSPSCWLETCSMFPWCSEGLFGVPRGGDGSSNVTRLKVRIQSESRGTTLLENETGGARAEREEDGWKGRRKSRTSRFQALKSIIGSVRYYSFADTWHPPNMGNNKTVHSSVCTYSEVYVGLSRSFQNSNPWLLGHREPRIRA